MYQKLVLTLSVFFLSLILKIFYLKKVLLLLMTVELVNIVLFIALYMMYHMESMWYIMCMAYVTLCVTEGVLGLCILIKMTRSCGGDLVRGIKKG